MGKDDNLRFHVRQVVISTVRKLIHLVKPYGLKILFDDLRDLSDPAALT